MRLNADLESGRSLVSHPRRKAGKGAVKLVHNEKRGAASLKPPPNVHDLAKAGVKSVSDACFSLLFVGSMSPFRAAAALREASESDFDPTGNCCRWTSEPIYARASSAIWAGRHFRSAMVMEFLELASTATKKSRVTTRGI
jgi:hypothetical protein